jgi:hypothetical protein
MKTYIDYNTMIRLDQSWIPKNSSNTYYQQFLEELNNKEAELVPYVPSWDEIRGQRDNLLVQSDWAVLPDATPEPNEEAWLNYRQALRNIPQTFSNPEDVVWPQKP